MPVVKKVNLVVHGGGAQFNGPFTLSDTVSDLRILPFTLLGNNGIKVNAHGLEWVLHLFLSYVQYC